MSLKIDNDKLETWIKSTFDFYKQYKDDYLINSIFKEDRKFKLSISPSKQCFHCWKTDNSGPLWKLVCEVESCSKQEAIDLIYETNSLDNFQYKIDLLKNQYEKKENKNISKKFIDYPESFQFVTEDLSGEINIKALRHVVLERNLDPIQWKMGYCYKGKYSKRLIIPFFDKENNLIYYIARSLFGQEPKYMNPPVDDPAINVKKEDVLFSKDWNFKDQDVIIVEGALDAMTLIDLGFNAVSIQGKSISTNQINMLRTSRNMVLGLDNDKPGRNAMESNIRTLNNEGIYNIKYIFPPLEGSDWNECYLKLGEKLKDYINNNINLFDFKASILNKLNKNKL